MLHGLWWCSSGCRSIPYIHMLTLTYKGEDIDTPDSQYKYLYIFGGFVIKIGGP